MPAGEIEDVASPAVPDATPAKQSMSPADPGEAKQVETWLARIAAARKHWSKAFKRMKQCQQVAAYGAAKEWLDDEERYVVPVLGRHVNLAVAQLYARNPTVTSETAPKLRHLVWDGTQEQVVQLTERAQLGDLQAEQMLAAILNDIATAQAEQNMVDRAAETLAILLQYYLREQPAEFKAMVKAAVRRAKVNGVAYCKVTFLRENAMAPEPGALAEDSVAKIRTIQRLMEDLAKDDDVAREAKEAELASLQRDVAANPDRPVREQVIYDFPRSTEIILDPKTRHLRTLSGCGWLAHEFDYTAERIRDIWGVDVEADMSIIDLDARSMLTEGDCGEREYRVYEVQDKYRQQVFVIAEGVKRFIVRPAEPATWMEGFFNLFPLVFNEIEHDEDIIPPSDVWNARHMQAEYNRSRNGLREHRTAARPYWLAARGRLERDDKNRLENHAAHAIVEVSLPDPRANLASVVVPGPTAPIDPNLYETEGVFADVQRTIGTQEANFGGVSGATATESSIAETSRQSGQSSDSDDLDEWLTLILRRSGQLALQEVSAERVKEIVGPGAVWPDLPLSRKVLADEINVVIKAGSSGRPNQAMKLANMERAWPALSMLPGVNPAPLGDAYADLLDIDPKQLRVDGALSIAAQNAMARAAPPTSAPPEAQGAAGADNAPRTGQAPGAQPAFTQPAAAPGLS